MGLHAGRRRRDERHRAAQWLLQRTNPGEHALHPLPCRPGGLSARAHGMHVVGLLLSPSVRAVPVISWFVSEPRSDSLRHGAADRFLPGRSHCARRGACLAGVLQCATRPLLG